MLVLHSSSRCDVCLSEYSWDSAGKRPHAIACGHIFCRDCLYANSPPLCPLCRKLYQPNKMKKLHVDRPENIDDHKEIDLLQRLAISWETPPEQLEEVTTEVDAWLRDRSDDACIALRKARAALEKNRELKESDASLRDTIAEMAHHNALLKTAITREKTVALVHSEGYKTMIEGLTKDIVALKLEIEGMQSLTHRYTHSRNPLPRPPEPISTDQVPTFEQAVSESGSGMRFIDLPSSPRRYPEAVSSPLRYPFDSVENRDHRKGKSKSKDHKSLEDTKYRSSSSLNQQAPLSPRHNPTSHYVQPHVSPAQHDGPPTSTRALGLQTHFPNTNQPLDEYALVSVYLREYSSGFVNGQQVAAANRPAPVVYPGRSYTAHPIQTGSGPTRYPVQPTSTYEPSDPYRQGTTTVYPNQNEPESRYGRSERPSRRHHRQETAPSIMSSSTSSAPIERSRSPSTPRSRSRSRTGALSSSVPPTQNAAATDPAAAALYSTPPPDVPVRPTSHRDSLVPTSPLTAPQLQPHQQAILTRPSSRASGRTHHTVLSNDTWGTAADSNLASGSLISGLRTFAVGAEPILVGGQEPVVFRELGSDGASIRTRESFSEPVGDGAAQSQPLSMSPARQIHSMVGVLPSEEGPAASTYNPHSHSESSRTMSARDERRSDAAYRSPTAVDPRSSQYSLGGWSQQSGRESGRSRNDVPSGYQTDGDRAHRQRHQQPHYEHTTSNYGTQQSRGRDDRSGTYRSPTSANHHRSAYESRDPRERNHTSSSYSSSRNYANNEDRRYSQSHSHSNSRYYNDDQRSIASSDRHSRSSRASRAPALPTRGQHLSLPEESPFPLTVEYTDTSDDSEEGLDDPIHRRRRDSHGQSRRRTSNPGSAPAADSDSFGNALGLQLTTGPTPLSAPTPVASSHGFLRSWSHEH